MLAGSLYASALLLGLTGGIHCVAMCGALGGGVCGGIQRPAFRAWNMARVASYGVAGALVGGSADWMASVTAHSPAVKALWVMLQVTIAVVGLAMLLWPRASGWALLAGSAGWQPVHFVARHVQAGPVLHEVQTLPSSDIGIPRRAWRPFAGALSGFVWAGFPCGLLHAALLMAWMSGSAEDGAFVMLLFAGASAAWLLAGAGVIRRLRQSGRWTDLQLRRLAGAVIVISWVLMLLDGGSLPGQAGLFCRPGV